MAEPSPPLPSSQPAAKQTASAAPATTPTSASRPAAAPAAPKPTPKAGPGIDRRGFLWMGWSALAAFLGGSAAATARFFFPNVIYEPSQKFNAGPAKSYDLGVSTRWLNEQRVWIVRTSQGFYVLWARCTHLGCTPNWFGDQGRFRCPCHGSNFNPDGDVIAGPAPRPLWRTKIELASTGDLIVDKAVLEDRPGMRENAPYFVTFNA